MKFIHKKVYLSILLVLVMAVGLLVGTLSAASGGGTTVEEITFDLSGAFAYSMYGDPSMPFSATFSGNMFTKPNGDIEIKVLNGTADLGGNVMQIHLQPSEIKEALWFGETRWNMPVKIQLQGSGGEQLEGAGVISWTLGTTTFKHWSFVGQTQGWRFNKTVYNPPTIVPR